MKKLMFITALLLTGQSFAQQALGDVIGEVVEIGTVVPVDGAVAYIEDQGQVYRAKSDIDGRFRISGIPSGTYILNVRKFEDTVRNIIVEVPIDGFANAGQIELGKMQDIDVVNVVAKDPNRVRLIDGNLPVATLTAKEIDKSPLKFDVKGLVTSMSSEVRQTADGELVFRGARKGDMIYLIDGVKTRDVGSVPGVAIGRMQVYTGGLPAKYGDTMGGVVVMETKSYFDLYRAWEADQIRKGLR